MTEKQVKEALAEAFDLDIEARVELEPKENGAWKFHIQAPEIDYRYEDEITIHKWEFANGQASVVGDYNPASKVFLAFYEKFLDLVTKAYEAETPMTTTLGFNTMEGLSEMPPLYVFVSKNFTYDERLSDLKARVTELEKRQASDFEKNALKEALKKNIERQAIKGLDEKYLVSGRRSYTFRELLDEIERETPFGLNMMVMILNLTINLLSRGEEKLDANTSGAEANKWVAISDKMPTAQGHYLVKCESSFPKNCKVVVAEFEERNQNFYSEAFEFAIKDVTHWCNIPTEKGGEQ